MPLGLGLGLSPVLYCGASGPYRVSITADADDGHERLDTNALNTASVVAGDAGTYLAAAFWRFTGIAVPIGTTITSATITVTSSASGGSGTAVIRAQKSASPAAAMEVPGLAYVNTTGDIAFRTCTDVANGGSHVSFDTNGFNSTDIKGLTTGGWSITYPL